MKLTYDNVEEVLPKVIKNQWRWNGYDIEVFTPRPGRYFRPDGVFWKEWGTVEVISPNSDGKWEIPARYLV